MAQWLRRVRYTRYGERTVYSNNAKDLRPNFFISLSRGRGGGGAQWLRQVTYTRNGGLIVYSTNTKDLRPNLFISLFFWGGGRGDAGRCG